MALLLLALLLHIAVQVLGSNYGYVEWSDSDREDRNPAVSSKQNTHREPPHHRPTYPYHSLLTTERTLVAHKIEEDLPRVVTAFLHSGDPSALGQVTCSKRYELSSLKGGPQVASHHSLHGVLDTLAHAANFLNTLLQANRFATESVNVDVHWYNALVRSILEGDAKIHRAVLTFHTDAAAPRSRVSLQAVRTGNEEEVVLQERPHLRAKSPESDWVHEFKKGRRRSLAKSESYLLNRDQIKWSAPYLECENGAFVPYWLLTLTAGFYGLKNDSALEFRGIVRVDVNLQDVDIDQCSTNGWFAGTHRCNLTSMECTPIAGHGFVLDKYKCQCRRGFYHPHRVALNGFKSEELGSHRDEISEVSSKCLPCRKGCTHCQDDAPCLVLEDGALRLPLASLQALCIVIDLALMVVVYYFRSNKSIRTSGLILLEAIMFGALLLYFPVMIYYFRPSVFRCILLRWMRLLGFTIMYGTVILKLYRVLKVFLSRTAQRTPYMTSWRVVRLLAVILLVVLWFLVAWTLAVCQNQELSRALITTGLTPESLQFSICLLDRWDYMMAVAEFLFLLWGVYLCYAVRTVPTAFHEPRYIAVAVYNELLISAIFHIIRFSLVPGLHPDWMLMLFFAHTQLTVTVTLALLLVPKFLSNGTQARDDVAAEVYEEEFDMGRSGSYLNNSTTSAWSEHSVDPDDIRDELKKLYAQLEVYKCKKMLANNPHIQKKRSSKKGLGRTLMKRITEFPESMHRQSSREDSIEHDSNRSTLKRNPPELNPHGKPLDDSLKDKLMGLKKSFSYDHVCEQDDETASQTGSLPGEKAAPVAVNGEASLLGSLIGRRHTKKHPEPAVVLTPPKLKPAESTESVPLFWKSASAHNLTHEKKTVHLRTSIMQKSLSVITSAKEKMPGLSNKTHSVEDASKKGLTTPRGRMLSGVDETPEHFPKMIISQSVEYSKTPLKMGIMKQQVSGSQPSICSEMGRNLYDVSEVCTWEMDEEETPVELKAHKHVSIASAETTTAASSRRGSGGSSSCGLTKPGRSQQRQKPGQSPSNRRRSKDKSGENHGGCRGQKSGPVRSPLPKKPNVSTFEFDEQPMTARESDSISPDRIRRKKSVTPTDGKPKGLHSDHSKSTGSLMQPPSLMLEICPWDYTSPPSPEREICTRPAAHKKKRKGSCSSNHRGEREKGKERSRERRSSSGKPSSERRRISQSSESGGPVPERRRSSTRDPELTEIGGTEVMFSAETEPKHSHLSQKPKPSPDRKKSSGSSGSKPAVNTETKRDVCPWDFEDSCERA